MNDGISKFYEEWHDSASDNRSEEIRDRDLLAINYLSDCDSIFELGCGSGVVLNMASAKKKAGADISQKAIQTASSCVQASGGVDLKVVNVDNEDLPWNSQSFNGCMAIEVLEHLFDPVHALSELNRILLPKGKIVITVPNIGYYYYRYYHLFSGEVSDFHGNGLILNEHIRYYCAKSMNHLLRLTGFGEIKVKGVMKKIVNNNISNIENKGHIDIKNIIYALRPTPLNILSKSNSLFSLYKRFPGLFAVGLVFEAIKIEESQYRYNSAVDHQKRTGDQEKLNINAL